MTEELKQAITKKFRIVSDEMGFDHSSEQLAEWVACQIKNKTPIFKAVISSLIGG